MTLAIDFETRSAVDLKTRGVYNYMDDQSTEPLMASYAIDGGPIRRWRPPAPCPPDIVAHVAAGGTISAHNAAFERLLWQKVLTPRYGWPAVATDRFRCTAATAAAMSLPRDLAGLGAALDLDVQKDTEGKRLIRKFSVPRKPRKGETKTIECPRCQGWGAVDGEMDYHGPCEECHGHCTVEVEYGPDDVVFNAPEGPDFELFHDYCDDDVRAEEGADRRMVPLSADEQDVYVLGEIINDRGIRIDLRSAHAALRLADKAKARLDAEMRICTNGYVGSCTQVAKLVEWVQSRGVELTSAAKADVEELLSLDDLPADVRRAVELRQEAAKTSVSKLRAMIDRASADSRARGANVYHAAGTGRFQSVGVNFNNMPRPRRCFDDAHLDRTVLFDAIRSEDPDVLKLLYGDELGRPLHLLSDAIRGFIWAAPGHDLVQADYSGIEGAVIAWSSGEDWKLEALFGIIADPDLPDLYRRAAASILNLPIEVVTKKHWARQAVGKVSELALGFGGGVAAFDAMSRGYGVQLDPLFEPVWAAASEERREKAAKRYAGCLKRAKEKTDVLSREAWLACELIKVGWRAANPAIAAGWRLREAAVREAIQNPGTVTTALKCSYVVKMGFLWCMLPSGRCLAYGAPRLRDQVWAEIRLDDGSWSDAETMDRMTAEKLALKGEVRIQGATSPSISALSVDSQTKRWTRTHLYGGLLAENDTQAIARDLLVNGMRKAEAAGYPIIAHVYDEMIAEVPRGTGDLKAFERLICELPPWAAGMPLTAGGWRGKRYRKD